MVTGRTWVGVLVLISAEPLFGQSINIDFGSPLAGPQASYAAAGLPGVWNSIEGEHTPFWDPEVIYDLIDLDSQPTGVTLYQYGGTELLAASDPSVTGNDSALLNDCLVTHSTSLETCLWINGLENGTYEVLSYAWMPNEPLVNAQVRFDFNPELVLVGGAWPGQHEEEVTYARHVVEVTDGFIGAHSGMPSGGDPLIGAALNGLQLRYLDEDLPGDSDGDGDVDLADYDIFNACMTGPDNGPVVSAWEASDLNGDADVDLGDYASLQLAFTGPL